MSTYSLKRRDLILYDPFRVSMTSYIIRVSVLVFLAAMLAHSAPAVPASETVTPSSDDPNNPVYSPDSSGPAQPIRGNLGATILGPQNIPLQQQNPDALAPPTTDHGTVYVFPTWLVCGGRPGS
jgi:hypothetical protein